jgi:hypothetical protein
LPLPFIFYFALPLAQHGTTDDGSYARKRGLRLGGQLSLGSFGLFHLRFLRILQAENGPRCRAANAG